MYHLYLYATKDKDPILNPTKELSLNMFVNVDFAGMWQKEFAELRSSVLSRTFAIIFCGCPGTWSNKHQTEIAL